MTILSRILIALVISCLTITSVTTAQTSPTRIRFASGATSTQITDSVDSQFQDQYIFRAFAGQVTSLAVQESSIDSPNDP